MERLGDAEVEQASARIAADEDVRRLDVPMDDQVAVRIRDGVAHLTEEIEPLSQARAIRSAVVCDRLALDVFHDGIRPPVGRDSTVEQTCDSGMVEAARIWRSALKRSSSFAASPRVSLSAARCSNWPSARSASYTSPIPPCPMSRAMRHAPMRFPARATPHRPRARGDLPRAAPESPSLNRSPREASQFRRESRSSAAGTRHECRALFAWQRPRRIESASRRRQRSVSMLSAPREPVGGAHQLVRDPGLECRVAGVRHDAQSGFGPARCRSHALRMGHTTS